MAFAPPPRAPLSSLRFSWPTGCSHEKMPPEAPIELRTARPMVPSAQRDSTELKSKNLQAMIFVPPDSHLAAKGWDDYAMRRGAARAAGARAHVLGVPREHCLDSVRG